MLFQLHWDEKDALLRGIGAYFPAQFFPMSDQNVDSGKMKSKFENIQWEECDSARVYKWVCMHIYIYIYIKQGR